MQICNSLLENVMPPATQDPNLDFTYVKRFGDAAGLSQVTRLLARLDCSDYRLFLPPDSRKMMIMIMIIMMTTTFVRREAAHQR